MASLILPMAKALNFHNLALFICHLFIDGHFRFGHIIYEPKVFDGQLLTEIDSICSVQIPWQSIDITQSVLQSPQTNDRSDHILQLIFFDGKFLAEQIDEYKDYLTFYRIFIFTSTTDEIETKRRISVIGRLNLISNASPLILQYNPKNGVIRVDFAFATDEKSENSEKCTRNDVDNESRQQSNKEYDRIFDRTFGKYEKYRSMIVKTVSLFRHQEDYEHSLSNIPHSNNVYLANYYYSSLNVDFINMTCAHNFNPNASWANHMLTHKHRHFYNELSLEYVELKNEQE